MRLILTRLFLCLAFSLLAFPLNAKDKGENDASTLLHQTAERFQAYRLTYYQPYVYFSKIESEQHDAFLFNDPQTRKRRHAEEDDLLQTVNKINMDALKTNAERVYLAKLRENLESSIATRICRSELWNIDHFFGTHWLLTVLTQNQPVGTVELERNALTRWGLIADYYQQDVRNLKSGLKLGYSTPKSVVTRVIGQLDAILSLQTDALPYMAITERSENIEFKRSFRDLLETRLRPAMSAYRDFLRDDYLPKARTALGIGELPNGRECYMARYRSYTTLSRTPEEVFELGLKTVEKRKTQVTDLGKRLFNKNSFEEIIALINDKSEPDFKTAAELSAFYEEVVARSKIKSADYFYSIPDAELLVEAIPEHQQGFGREAFYIPETQNRKASFSYDPSIYATQKFGAAEIIAVHEGYPGHHMQIASAKALELYHPTESIFSNSAYSEGWGRYSEDLAEEMGLFQHESAKILRRAWPARGMVADTALHILGWSKQEVADFLKASGSQYTQDMDALLDRMAIWPGQLTAYDSGALEIQALRTAMQTQQAEKFDIKEFHHRVLKNGAVPMSLLKRQVLENR